MTGLEGISLRLAATATPVAIWQALLSRHYEASKTITFPLSRVASTSIT
jgi:hypothetical protein